ncbi:unnamed protein product, partial [Ectocarpus sp. 4 AP-2014]
MFLQRVLALSPWHLNFLRSDPVRSRGGVALFVSLDVGHPSLLLSETCTGSYLLCRNIFCSLRLTHPYFTELFFFRQYTHATLFERTRSEETIATRFGVLGTPQSCLSTHVAHEVQILKCAALCARPPVSNRIHGAPPLYPPLPSFAHTSLVGMSRCLSIPRCPHRDALSCVTPRDRLSCIPSP